MQQSRNIRCRIFRKGNLKEIDRFCYVAQERFVHIMLQPLYTAVVSSVVELDSRNAVKKGEAPRKALAATALQ